MLIVAHGSSDWRFASVVESIAAQIRVLRPGLDVRVGYLDHGPPHLADVATPGAVAVPLLLSSGYHVRVDIPEQAPDVTVTAAVGPDPRLAVAVRDRLVEASYDGSSPVVLVAAGSGDPAAVADVRLAATQLEDLLGVETSAAFVATSAPLLADVDVSRSAVATYLLAPGAFADAVLAGGAQVVSAPIGAHPALAEIILDRYDHELGAATPTS